MKILNDPSTGLLTIFFFGQMRFIIDYSAGCGDLTPLPRFPSTDSLRILTKMNTMPWQLFICRLEPPTGGWKWDADSRRGRGEREREKEREENRKEGRER